MRLLVLILNFSFLLLEGAPLWAVECSSSVWRVKVKNQRIEERTCITKTEKLANQVLRPATYNIKGLSDRAGLIEDFQTMSEYGIQIFALQEVHVRPEEREFPAALLRLLPDGEWFSCFRALNLEDSKLWEGQAIVSALPFSKCRLIPLEHNGDKRRAAVKAEFQFENSPVWVVNTDHEVKLFELGPSDRARQLHSLENFFAANRDIPVVLLGDFNTTGNSYPFGLSSEDEIKRTYEILARVGFTSLSSIPRYAITFKTWGNQLDHILLRGFEEGRWHRYDFAIGSDHFPIYTEVELK